MACQQPQEPDPVALASAMRSRWLNRWPLMQATAVSSDPQERKTWWLAREKKRE